jgi:fructose-bisphosphate aldolase class II
MGHYVRGRAARESRCRRLPLSNCSHIVAYDHAQDEEIIEQAANMNPGFDSIMVDMSHYEKEENLERTACLVNYCHERGISTKAEPGWIEG